MATPAARAVDSWHGYLQRAAAGPTDEVAAALDAMLSDAVVFRSPVVFTPQVGRELTRTYLLAALATLNAPEAGFRYVREVIGDRDAVLEFETTLDGKLVHGVDLIAVDEDARIVDFTVMVRPLQGVQAIHATMGAMLATMSSATGGRASSDMEGGLVKWHAEIDPRTVSFAEGRREWV